MELFADVIGIIGALAIVVVYFLLQLEKITHKSLIYNGVNLLGSVFLLISLCINFNLASFVIEIFWIVASCIGLYKFAYKKKSKE